MKITDDMLKMYIRYNNRCNREIAEHDRNINMKLNSMKSKLTGEDLKTVKAVFEKTKRAEEPTFPIFMLGITLLIPVVIILIFCRGVESISWRKVEYLAVASVFILALAVHIYTKKKNFRDQLYKCMQEIEIEDKIDNVPTYEYSVQTNGNAHTRNAFSTSISCFDSALVYMSHMLQQDGGDTISHMDVEYFNNAAVCIKAQVTSTKGKEIVIDIIENH
jgi:hypothetical protein